MKAIKNIDEAWNEVTQSCMKGVWKKLCSELLEVQNSLESDTIQNIIEEISNIAISGGIEGVDVDDIQALLRSHR